MNLFRKLLIISLIGFFAFSCRDKCKDVDCGHGDCIEGLCTCDEGWDGENCDNKLSQKFTGVWTGPFTCVTETQDVIINIKDFATDPKKLNINTVGLGVEFNGASLNLDSTILFAQINDDYASFTIDTQTVIIKTVSSIGISAKVYGEGELQSENSLFLFLNASNKDLASFDCNGVATK